ncbi:Ribonuclease H2 subunit A [Penicillium chermesinum]|uniref:Ribonuclease n=1 Tax=Penicillium chermesinum TaxID=63820 RepID=A0A9W9TMI2_9EURO|nr:Ribonuclease H2 subunit A [Penicillium chermesinum]KAJ5231955.1 Ribonuclease H2 subunit A [Penicillium chermesinum]
MKANKNAPMETVNDDLAFIPPSVDTAQLVAGESYTYYTPCPVAITPRGAAGDAGESTPCVLGVDEAGRGPVIGPMVYGLLLAHQSSPSSACPGSQFRRYNGCYHRDHPGVVEERKVNVQEVYIDTIGNPTTYQQKLERIFPSLKITVAKKADSLYPCVSAASVAAKVTRDVALEVLYKAFIEAEQADNASEGLEGWGSGYPSDSKCVNWLRRNMDPIFGWGNNGAVLAGDSQGNARSEGGTRVDWPDEEEGVSQLNEFLLAAGPAKASGRTGLRDWYGSRPSEII